MSTTSKLLNNEAYHKAQAHLEQLEADYWPKRLRLREMLASGTHTYYHAALNSMKQEILLLRAKIRDYEQGL